MTINHRGSATMGCGNTPLFRSWAGGLLWPSDGDKPDQNKYVQSWCGMWLIQVLDCGLSIIPARGWGDQEHINFDKVCVILSASVYSVKSQKGLKKTATYCIRLVVFMCMGEVVDSKSCQTEQKLQSCMAVHLWCKYPEQLMVRVGGSTYTVCFWLHRPGVGIARIHLIN